MKNYVLNNENLEFEVKQPSNPPPRPAKSEPEPDLLVSEDFEEKNEAPRNTDESPLRRTKLLSDFGKRTETIKEVDEEIEEIKEEQETEDIKEQKDEKPRKLGLDAKKSDENPKSGIAKVNPFLLKSPKEEVQDFELDVKSDKESLESVKEEIKTVAVLGACGFLGFKITKLLLEKGYSVVMGIPEDTSTEDQELIQSVKEQYPEQNIEVFEFNFFDSSKSEQFLRGSQALIHCARVRRK